MSGNSTSLYGSSSSNGVVSSNNLTTLYPGSSGSIVAGTAYGNANVVSLLAVGTDGANTVGNIKSTGIVSASGNIVTGGYFVGNFAGNITGNVTAPGANTDVLFNFQGNVGASSNLTFNSATNTFTVANTVVSGNVSTPTVYNNGMQMQGYDYVQMQYSNSVTLPVSPYDIGTGSWFYLDPGGGVFQSNTTGALKQVVLGNDGTVSATGNVTAPYFLGNGSQLTGLPATYSNVDVSNFLANGFGSNTISTTGNITSGYILGNGSQLTGIVSSTYGNAQVATFLSAFGSNVISTSGNITGGYILGNGSQLTGLPATYGNANVVANLAALGTNPVSTTGNITASYFIGNGALLTNINASNIVGAYGNAQVASFLNAFGSNTISTTGNVTASYFVGNGSLLSSITGGNVSGTVANATYATSAGTATFADTANAVAGANVSGTVANATYATSAGSATTAGTANSVAGANVSGTVANATYALTANASTYANTVTDAAQANITSVGILTSLSVSGNTTAGNLLSGGIVSATGNITGSYILGNGSQLTGLPAGYSNANVSNFLANGFGSNTISTSGNITGGYFLGNGSQLTGVVANLQGNMSGNISGQGLYSINNLRTLQVSALGNISIGTAVIAQNNVSPATINITADELTTNLLFSAGGNVTAPNVIATANSYATYFFGNGSQLTGIVANGSSTSISSGTSNVKIVTANGNATVNIGGTSNVVQWATTGEYVTGVVSATGNVTGGNITTSGFVSAAGNIAATGWVFGNTGGSFNGPVNATSLSATGNVTGGNLLTTGLASITGNLTAGNIITVGSTINNTNAWAYSPANTLLSTNNARIIIGNAYDGNAAVQYDPINITRGSRLAVMDKQSYDYTANSLQPGARLLTSYFWLDLAGTTVPAASSSRNSAGAFVTNVGNGTSAQTSLGFYGVQAAIAVGNTSNPSLGNVGNIGNVTLNFAVGQGSFVNLYNGSTANNAIGTYSSLLVATAGGVMGNSIGYAYSRADAANSLSTWNIGYFHPDNTAIFGSSMSGNARLATNYYAFYNKDTYADVQLGSLRNFHYYTSNILATGGSQAISKSNGQYQTTTGVLTANLDITSFTNFQTSTTVTAGTNTGTKLSSDVVTLLVPVGATPYSINMPGGNTSIYYTSNSNVVTGVANSLVQVQITAGNIGGAVRYLVDVANVGRNV